MRKKVLSFIKYLVLTLCSFVVILPFVTMLLNSVKPGNEILNAPLSFPSRIVWDGYIGVFTSLNIGRLFLNTVFVAGSVMVLNVFLSICVAYAIVKCNIRGRNIWLAVILSTMMLPSVLLLIPQYQMFFRWGWLDTYKVLIIPNCLSAYNVFLMVQFLKGLNDEFLEAARIDGANEPFILFRIVMPLSMPVISTVGIMSFMNSWNDFVNPLLYIRDYSKMTLQLAIYTFKAQLPNGQMEQLWAATTLVTIPIVFAYLFAQKNFVKAFTGVGLK